MYSPKIREDLIPRIYDEAKQSRVPMTAWVSQKLEQVLENKPPGALLCTETRSLTGVTEKGGWDE